MGALFPPWAVVIKLMLSGWYADPENVLSSSLSPGRLYLFIFYSFPGCPSSLTPSPTPSHTWLVTVPHANSHVCFTLLSLSSVLPTPLSSTLYENLLLAGESPLRAKDPTPLTEPSLWHPGSAMINETHPDDSKNVLRSLKPSNYNSNPFWGAA